MDAQERAEAIFQRAAKMTTGATQGFVAGLLLQLGEIGMAAPDSAITIWTALRTAGDSLEEVMAGNTRFQATLAHVRELRATEGKV